MLDLFKRRTLSAPHLASAVGSEPNQAAVLMAFTDNSSCPEIILTQRSSKLPVHRGEVSLPGGKWEAGDESLMHTALREAHEEIGLDPSQVDVLTSLDSSQTGWNFNVSTFIGVVPEGVHLEAQPDEIDAIFSVPVQFFLDDQRVRTDVFSRQHQDVWSPVYEYQGYTIWGFTARMITRALNDFLDAGLTIEHSAPQKFWDQRKGAQR